MRRWWAVLAFVPAVAWGDCYSVEVRESYMGVALSMLDARERGVSEREAVGQVFQHITGPADKAAGLEAVKLVYGPLNPGPSTVVSAMQMACDRETRR